MNELERFLAAKYPILFVETHEEYRLVDWLKGHVKRPVYHFSLATGLQNSRKGQVVNPAKTFQSAWEAAAREAMVLVVFDFQHAQGPGGYRLLLDHRADIEARGSTVILVAPNWSRLADELTRYGPILEWALPDREHLRGEAASILTDSKLPTDKAALLAEEALGLTETEARNAFALAVRACNFTDADPMVVRQERLRRIRSVTGIEVALPSDLADVGGMSAFKRWLTDDVLPFMDHPKLRVKSTLLVGPPGTGKSLVSRALGKALNLPVVRLDLAACRGQYLGQSEANLRSALRTINALGKAVVWLDELDSATAGHESSAMTDGGVTLSLISILLTWMQERNDAALIAATANYPWRIPPALLRPGRIDAIWSVDLPTVQEREEIAAIHLKRLDQDVQYASLIARHTPDYSGAEVAGVVNSVVRRSLRQNVKITDKLVQDVASEVTPLSSSRREDLAKMRQWAAAYARNASGLSKTAQQLSRNMVED